MSKQIAFLGAAFLGLAGSAGAASAADYPAWGDQPPAYHDHRAPGPVVYDERAVSRRDIESGYREAEPGYRDIEPGYDDVDDRVPVAVGRPAYRAGFGGPAGFVPPPTRYGDGFRPAPLYRAAAVPAGPAYGEAHGGPDVACTVDEAQSTTPAGWRKIVTRRTCYRR